MSEGIDMTAGRTLGGGVAMAPHDDELDFTRDDLTILARGIAAISGVTELLERKFGPRDSLPLVMRAAMQACRELVRDNATPDEQAEFGPLLDDEP